MKKVNENIEDFNEEEFRNIFDDIDERFYDRYQQEVKYNEGKKEGKKEAYSNTAINLYKNKIPIDIITASTGITKQELMKLIN